MTHSRHKILEALETGDMTAQELAVITGGGYYHTYSDLQALMKSGHIEVIGSRLSDKRQAYVKVYRRTSQPIEKTQNPYPTLIVNIDRDTHNEFKMNFPNMAAEMRRLIIQRLDELKAERAQVIGKARLPIMETTHT